MDESANNNHKTYHRKDAGFAKVNLRADPDSEPQQRKRCNDAGDGLGIEMPRCE